MSRHFGKKHGSYPAAPTKQPGTFSKLFAEVAKVGSREVGRAWVFVLALGTVVVWAIFRPFLRVLGYLAACDQHRYDHRHVSDGVSDPKFAEP